MAQKVSILHVDDIDGSEITDNDVPTVSFALDGTNYEIDLSDKNQDKMRKALAPYIEAGRKVGKSTSGKRSAAKASGPVAADIRAWAKENGHDVPDRGRIPAEVREAFEAAN